MYLEKEVLKTKSECEGVTDKSCNCLIDFFLINLKNFFLEVSELTLHLKN